MGLWQVDADTLAGSRFVVSPLAETTACLFALDSGSAAHPAERAWLGAHRDAYRRRLAADPVTARLLRAARGHRWNADFLTPAPAAEGEPDFAEELRSVREASPEAARADLEVSLGRPLPRLLRREDLPGRAGDLLEWVWNEAVAPDWPRRRRILEADVLARTDRLTRGGWAAALDGMRPGMRWLGESRLRINTQDRPPRETSGAPLLFVPVTARQGWAAWDLPHRYALVYPCAGTLAGADRVDAPDSLGRLIGPARAAVLALLDTPKSTSQLVALTGQGLGSVGRHLRVLLDAGLVSRRRAGRSVLYCRTPAGELLLGAGDAAGQDPWR